MGWWFGRILTFEVVGDEAPPSVAAILLDATGGMTQADCDTPVSGFAAYGSSSGSAVAPLVEAFGIHLFDDGLHLRPAQQIVPMVITNAMLGNGAGDEQAARMELEQAPAAALPSSLRLGHYAPAHDFQSAEARSSVSDEAGIEQRHELPAVIESALAKAIAEDMLARRWVGRDRLTLRLPPSFIALEPGSVVGLDTDPDKAWRVERCTIDRFVVVAELRAHRPPIIAASAPSLASGSAAFSAVRMASIDDASETDGFTLALFEIPAIEGGAQEQPALLLAASSTTQGWRARAVDLALGTQVMRVQTARRKSVLGQLVASVPGGSPRLLDTGTAIDVQLIDPQQWLTSCDDDQLAGGSNLAVIGRELIQFGDALPLGHGRFQLGQLVRGVAGTDPAEHGAGEAFVVVQPDALRPVALPSWSKGAEATARARSLSGEMVSVTTSISGAPLIPPAPVHLTMARESDGSVMIRWVRRGRSPAWVDGADVPLCEQAEHYALTLTGTAGSILLKATVPEVRVGVTQVEGLGPGPAAVEVRQIGDWGASPPASCAVTL